MTGPVQTDWRRHRDLPEAGDMDTREIEFVEFDDAALPELLRSQVLSFLRLQWPEGFTGELRYRDWITRSDLTPYHLLYVAHGLVVSHLELIRVTVEHEGVSYKVRSPTTVLTYPSFQGEGWAKKLVTEAVRRIDASDADLGIVYCNPDLEGFYASCGWTPMPGARTVVGPEPTEAEESTDMMLMRFVTDKGQRGRDSFLRSPLWITDEW